MTDYDDDGFPMEDVYKITKIGSLFDDSGEYESTYYLVDGIVDQEWVNSKFPSNHCQHEYDCCGNWYARTGSIVGTDHDNTIVRQFWVQNI